MSKQESLEEAAERLYPTDYGEKSKNIINIIKQEAFIRGAKWQQEQIGNSEFLQKLIATLSDAQTRRLILEQFKKK